MGNTCRWFHFVLCKKLFCYTVNEIFSSISVAVDEGPKVVVKKDDCGHSGSEE